MKRILVLTALAATVATGASAMTQSSVNLSEIERYAPAGADVGSLTDGEISVLLNQIHGGDDEGGKGAFVRSFFAARG